MKRAIKKITALITAFMLIASVGVSVYAEEFDEEYLYDDTTTQVSDDAVNESDSSQRQTDADLTATVINPASEITIYSYKHTVYVGDTFTVKCKMKPSKSDDIIRYSSSSVRIATVDENGKVTAVSSGTAVITAKTTSGVKDRFTLTVKNVPVEEPSQTDEPLIDDQTDSTAFDEASQEDLIDDTNSTSTPSGSSKASDIELKHSSVTIYEGDTYEIIYELTPSDSTDTVSYRSVNKAVASVDANGVITARGAGNTRIVCTTGSGKSTKLNVTVLPVMTEEEYESFEEKVENEYNEFGELVPSMIRFAEESASVQVGATVDLNARVYPRNCKYTYTIKSDNPSVAKVNSKGIVTGKKAGTAIITITTDNGKTDSVYVTVYGDMIPGIDVSKWNGDINWKKVKNTGMAQFAMIRASYGYEDTDPMLQKNVTGCEKYDIPYGFYHYMYAKDTAEAKKEAKYFLNAINGYSPEYPVVLDIEEDFYKNMSKKEVTRIVITFMDELEKAGYYAMIYSYAKFFDDNLNMDEIEKYDIWVACWGDSEKLAENYSYHYGMWQYSETGTMDGIEEYVDLNYSLKDYRATILKYGLNK